MRKQFFVLDNKIVKLDIALRCLRLKEFVILRLDKFLLGLKKPALKLGLMGVMCLLQSAYRGIGFLQ